MGDLKSPIGDNLLKWGLGIYEFAESEKKSPTPNWIKYHQLGIWNTQLGISYPIGDLKSPIGNNVSNWGLGKYESGNRESEKKSPISNWIKYHKLGIWNTQLGILYPIGYFLLLVLYSENQSQIPNCIKYPQLGITNTQLGILYQIVFFFFF